MPTHRAVTPDVRAAITELCTEYVFRLDNGHAERVTELFAEDAVWEGPHGLLHGHAELDAVWTARAKWRTTTRHLISNIRLAWSAEDVLHGWITFTLFKADPDAQPLPVPLLVAEHIDTYSQAPDGSWLFQTRRVSAVFAQEGWAGARTAPR
jgi:ketosteroid isomerase-like protein